MWVWQYNRFWGRTKQLEVSKADSNRLTTTIKQSLNSSLPKTITLRMLKKLTLHLYISLTCLSD